MSVGTLRAIVDVIEEDGTDRMPGTCCFDTPTSNWDYLGVEVRCSVTFPHLVISDMKLMRFTTSAVRSVRNGV